MHDAVYDTRCMMRCCWSHPRHPSWLRVSSQIMRLPTHGRLYYNATGPFTDPREPGALLVARYQAFARTPGVALMLTYVPDEMIRGEPLDTFAFMSQDGQVCPPRVSLSLSRV
jgi:hypothetical protein